MSIDPLPSEKDIHLILIHFSDLHFIEYLQNTEDTTSSSIYKGVRPHSYFFALQLCSSIRNIEREYEKTDIPIQLVCTGDVTTTASLGAFEEVHNYLYWSKYVSSKIKVGINYERDKIFFVPGNHDTWFRRAGLFARWQPREFTLRKYFPGNFPDCRIIRDRGNRHYTFFLLDSNRCKPRIFSAYKISQGEIGEEQRKSLNDLVYSLSNKDNRKLPQSYDYSSSIKIALLHHHIALPQNRTQMNKNKLLQLRDRKLVIDALKQHGIFLVLCGHQHEPYIIDNVDNNRVFLSCAGSATQLGESINSFCVYFFYKDKFKVYEYSGSSKKRILYFKDIKCKGSFPLSQ